MCPGHTILHNHTLLILQVTILNDFLFNLSVQLSNMFFSFKIAFNRTHCTNIKSNLCILWWPQVQKSALCSLFFFFFCSSDSFIFLFHFSSLAPIANEPHGNEKKKNERNERKKGSCSVSEQIICFGNYYYNYNSIAK